MPRILFTYLLKELMGPFIFGVAAFTAILVAGSALFEIIRLISQYHISMVTAGALLLLKLPGIVFYTFPMSMLLASLLSMGRLSGDSEIVAMKSGGISIITIMIPFVLIGFIVSIATVVLNEKLVPVANWKAKEMVYEISHKKKMDTTAYNIIYKELDKNGALSQLFYASSFINGEMQDVTIQQFDQGKLSRIVRATRAKWQDEKWVFENGNIYMINTDGETIQSVHFATYTLNISKAPLKLAESNKEPLEMTYKELSEYIDLVKASEGREGKVNQLEVQLYQKIAIPFASLVFVLIGGPLGLRPQRSSSSIGLGISILLIFIYYVILFVSASLGESGVIMPLLAAWIPNLIVGGIGVWLIWRQSRI